MKSFLGLVLLLVFVQDSTSKCLLLRKFPEVIAVITEWMVNGYTSKINPNSKNDLIIGECMAGFFGQEPPICNPRYLTTKSIPTLPKCLDLISQNHFSDIVIFPPNPFLKEIVSTIEGEIESKGGYPDEICDHLMEYVKHRMQSAEGGKFQRQKMDDFCKQNAAVCDIETLFLNDVKVFEQNLFDIYKKLSSIGHRFKRDTNASKDVLLQLIKLSLEGEGKLYTYPHPEQTSVHEKFSACIREFFQIMTDKLS